MFHLDKNFSETNDLAEREPEKLASLVALWWQEAEKHRVLPLDDLFGARFVKNAKRFHDARAHCVFDAGMGHVRTEAAPDVGDAGIRLRHWRMSPAAPKACSSRMATRRRDRSGGDGSAVRRLVMLSCLA
ncbi:MAG: hypothetical protein EXR07_20700 [Acetobacteraceae bacterium]|nr:hypothetical protein [Acetobacteraceae bacterium]